MPLKTFGKAGQKQGDHIKQPHKVKFFPPREFFLEETPIALELFWQPFQNGLSIQQQSKLVGGTIGGLDLYCLSEQSQQIGFGNTSEGHTGDMIAGALLVANSISSENWLSVFSLSSEHDYWWIVAKRQGAIYQDKVFRNQNKAVDEFNTLLEAPDWEHIIAPKEFKCTNAKDQSISNLINNVDGPKLKPTGLSKRYLLKWLLGFMLVGLLYFGYLVYQNRSDSIATDYLPIPVQSEVVIEPWQDEIGVEQFVNGCVEQITKLFFIVAGWQIDTLACQVSNTQLAANVRFDRQAQGTIAHLRTKALVKLGIQVEVDCTGNCAWLKSSIPFSKPQRTDEVGWTSRKVEEVLRERFQNLHLNLQLQKRGTRGPNPPSSTPSIMVLSRHDLSLVTRVGITNYLHLLNDIPGFVPESLTYSPNNNSWLFTAQIFHHSPRSVQPSS